MSSALNRHYLKGPQQHVMRVNRLAVLLLGTYAAVTWLCGAKSPTRESYLFAPAAPAKQYHSPQTPHVFQSIPTGAAQAPPRQAIRAQRSSSPSMGGPAGLPRIPDRALPLTKRFNPGGGYNERIATIWRDLETLYGREDVAGLGGARTYRDTKRYVDSGVKTGRFRGFTRSIDLREQTVFNAVKKEPSLLDPAVSNRFTFARSYVFSYSELEVSTDFF